MHSAKATAPARARTFNFGVAYTFTCKQRTDEEPCYRIHNIPGCLQGAGSWPPAKNAPCPTLPAMYPAPTLPGERIGQAGAELGGAAGGRRNRHAVLRCSAGRRKNISAGKPIPTAKGILPHGENMPMMIFRPNGEVIAMYGVTAMIPEQIRRQSVLHAFRGRRQHLAASRSLVTDTAGYDQRYFDMAVLPSGEAVAIWLDNRKFHQEGSHPLHALYHRRRAGFHRERPVVHKTVCQCAAARPACRCAGRPARAAFRDIIQDTIRDMVHIFSKDGGETFTRPVRISADNWAINGCPHTGPPWYATPTASLSHGSPWEAAKAYFIAKARITASAIRKRQHQRITNRQTSPAGTVMERGDLALVWDEAADTSGNSHRHPAQIGGRPHAGTRFSHRRKRVCWISCCGADRGRHIGSL